MAAQVAEELKTVAYTTPPVEERRGKKKCIDERIYLNLSKSVQSPAGLKTLKPAANGRFLMCKPLHLHLLYRSMHVYCSVII